jgi:pilus assembly protein CpaF
MQEIFRFDKLGLGPEGRVVGRFVATGVRPKVCDRLKTSGIHLPPEMFDGVVEVR